MQNTQAGHSCPLGPRTMPGGTSSSFLPCTPAASEDGGGEADVDLEERSTGSGLFGWLFFVGGEILGEGTEDEVVSALDGRRGLMFPIAVNGGCVESFVVGGEVGAVLAALGLGI